MAVVVVVEVVVMAEVRISEGKDRLLSIKATRVSLIGPPRYRDKKKIRKCG